MRGLKPKGQSTIKQAKKPMTLQEYNKLKFGDKTVREQPMLNSSGRTEYRIEKNGKNITNTKEGKRRIISQKMRNLEKRQDYEATNKPDIYMADPTGISSWGDAKRGAQHIGLMAQSGEWSGKRLAKDALDIVSAIPMANKLKAASTGLNLVKKVAATSNSGRAISKIAKKIVGAVAVDQTSQKISQDNIDKNKNKK